MPNVDKKCVTHHILTCDCIREQILDICEAVIKSHEDRVDNKITDEIHYKARNLIEIFKNVIHFCN